MSAVSSVVLYYSPLSEQPQYSYVASVSIFDGLTYDLIDKANVTGALNSKNESFLELVFRYPRTDVAGIYQCEIHGMERFGKPITVYNTAVVKGLMSGMFDIVTIIRDLRISNELLQSALKVNTEQSKYMERKQDEMKEVFGSIIFDYSPVNNGRRYALSTDQTYLNYTDFQRVCRLYGGYLAEIDDRLEFDFVQSYLFRKKLFTHIMIGGADELQEGLFINEHNNNSKSFVIWQGVNPNGGRNENCLVLYLTDNWRHGDYNCYLEIPQNEKL